MATDREKPKQGYITWYEYYNIAIQSIRVRVYVLYCIQQVQFDANQREQGLIKSSRRDERGAYRVAPDLSIMTMTAMTTMYGRIKCIIMIKYDGERGKKGEGNKHVRCHRQLRKVTAVYVLLHCCIKVHGTGMCLCVSSYQVRRTVVCLI